MQEKYIEIKHIASGICKSFSSWSDLQLFYKFTMGEIIDLKQGYQRKGIQVTHINGNKIATKKDPGTPGKRKKDPNRAPRITLIHILRGSKPKSYDTLKEAAEGTGLTLYSINKILAGQIKDGWKLYEEEHE